ncbi:hypothetical protein CL176_01405 [Suicoccus acidiformans]|uniref:DUF5067 domain-containing protein n=1 Tax=Suicoccus acidiformans TaxID=2036206 RepID=A0A347WI71_9LACT|nr:DUF5067 domain-containing protein [Suicoccus acidiformans]AXY24778.1 hypothetical protein CL176_01405 [Suicoccus acidiformans]
MKKILAGTMLTAGLVLTPIVTYTNEIFAVEIEDGKKIELDEVMEIGDYKITFTDFELGNDYEGNPVLIITYDWENVSDKEMIPFMSYSLTGYQDGVETSTVGYVEGLNLETGQKNVKPGGKVTDAQTTIGIEDLNKPLLLEIKEFFSFESGYDYAIELDLNDL